VSFFAEGGTRYEGEAAATPALSPRAEAGVRAVLALGNRTERDLSPVAHHVDCRAVSPSLREQLTSRVWPSAPSSQIASGAGNGLSGRGMVGKDALSRLLSQGGLAGSCFVEMTAFLTMTTLCETADCRRTPRASLHQANAENSAATEHGARNTSTTDPPLQFDLSCRLGLFANSGWREVLQSAD